MTLEATSGPADLWAGNCRRSKE